MLAPLLLILRQPDLGTALLLLIVFMPMIFLAGLKLWVLLASIVLTLFFTGCVAFRAQALSTGKSTDFSGSNS